MGVSNKMRRFSLLIKSLRAKGTLSAKISYMKDAGLFHQQGQTSRFNFSFGRWYPFLREKEDAGGTASGHYFHQDLLIARRIFTQNPIKHVDIGSRVDGFVAHVASFRGVEVLDIRPQPEKIPNIDFVQADLMRLDERHINYCDSLSCLHALEHFGLGRYGDPVDFDGFAKGLVNMKKILKSNGKFYLSVPIGTQRIEFNAHRIFAVKTLLSLLTDDFRIDSFSYVGDDDKLYENIVLDEKKIETNCGCNYGCGIFELTKK